jgi:exosome complex component RRP46
MERAILEALDGAVLAGMHPRTMIQISIQTLADDGSLLSCALNAAVLALMDAGVPMSSTLSAVTCAVDAAGNTILDPDAGEMKVRVHAAT